MSLSVLPRQLSSLLSPHDEMDQLSALTYCFFAVEGCLELVARGRSVKQNRASARRYAHAALQIAVCYFLFFRLCIDLLSF